MEGDSIRRDRGPGVDRPCRPPPHQLAAILVVRLGAMGDIIHTLPAVAASNAAFPARALPGWSSHVGVPARRQSGSRPDRALIAYAAGPSRQAARASPRSATIRHRLPGPYQVRVGRALRGARRASSASTSSQASRARRTSLFYHRDGLTSAAHVVEMRLGAGRRGRRRHSASATFPLPPGRPEGDAPDPAISCSPRRWPAGAPSSGPWNTTAPWPRYLGREFGIPLVLNGPPGSGLRPLPPRRLRL